MEYILAPKDAGCIFCDKPKSNDDANNLVVYRGQRSFVMMNLYPYNNGHILVAPYAHVPDLDAVDLQTQQEMLQLANQGMAIMRQDLQAQGFNFGTNIGVAAGAGIEEHVHFHVVPRWVGDTNFMPVLGETKVQVQSLRETRNLLAEKYKESR
ncbi:AP-4-A phosphorylase [subsurface metagenome]